MEALHGIGTFRGRPSAGDWTFDDALSGLLGHEPGAAAPTHAPLLDHVHPEDRDRLAEALSALARHHRPYCVRHRVVTAEGRTREVVGAGAVRVDGPDPDDPDLVGWVIALDGASGAPPLTEPALAGPADVVIPVPRGREGTGRAEPVVPCEAAGEAPVPAVRSGEPDGFAQARHAEVLRRAHDALVTGLELTPEAAASLVAWLANTHEVPPVTIAASLADLARDAAGRPDLAALLAVLSDGPRG